MVSVSMLQPEIDFAYMGLHQWSKGNYRYSEPLEADQAEVYENNIRYIYYVVPDQAVAFEKWVQFIFIDSVSTVFPKKLEGKYPTYSIENS